MVDTVSFDHGRQQLLGPLGHMGSRILLDGGGAPKGPHT